MFHIYSVLFFAKVDYMVTLFAVLEGSLMITCSKHEKEHEEGVRLGGRVFQQFALSLFIISHNTFHMLLIAINAFSRQQVRQL